MLIKSLKINNLRNINSASIEPHPQLNCFIGDNGAGKTSILEALVVLSKGRSFRAGQVASLIGRNDTTFRIFCSIQSDNGIVHKLGLERSAEQWSARHDGENVAQLSELTRLLPHVLLEPSTHTLVSGPPDGRRKYLDWGVFHVKQGFLLLWRHYNRVLKQRNAALRLQDAEVVESLDLQFVQYGEQLHAARKQQAERLSSLLKEKLPLFNKTLDGIELKYRKGWSTERLSRAIRVSLPRDKERGLTGPGPHKADLYLTLNGEPAKERLSRGEQKALAAALIMAQAQLISESGEQPLLLLDDLSSELDERHLGNVLSSGLELGAQIWLSGTKISPLILACSTEHAVFNVKQGRVESGNRILSKGS